MQGNHSADIVTTTIIVVVVVAATDTMVLAVLILFDLLLILLDSFPLGRHRPPPGCSALGPPACHRSRRSRPPSSYGSSWAWLLLAQHIPPRAPPPTPRPARTGELRPSSNPPACRQQQAAVGPRPKKRSVVPSQQGQQLLLFVFSIPAGALLLVRFPLPLARSSTQQKPSLSAARPRRAAFVSRRRRFAAGVCSPPPAPPRSHSCLVRRAAQRWDAMCCVPLPSAGGSNFGSRSRWRLRDAAPLRTAPGAPPEGLAAAAAASVRATA